MALTPTASLTLDSIFDRVAPQMTALDRFMCEQVEVFQPEVRAMAAYCLETSGKRLRPVLVFSSGWQGDGVIVPGLVRIAGVVEMAHLATLVHDDIMDKAELRRSRRTVSREFGPETAVLLGDALFLQALHIAACFPTTEVCRQVSAATRCVCSGEIIQTMRRRQIDVSLSDYYQTISLKTAEFFRVSCLLGAKFSGFNEDFAMAAESFGRHLGIAYQIYDDLVDFLGDEHKIGKTLGTDLSSGKITLPLIFWLEKLSESERTLVLNALRGEKPFPFAASVESMRHLGIAESVMQAIDEELDKAADVLRPLSGIGAVDMLSQISAILKGQVTNLSRAAASSVAG